MTQHFNFKNLISTLLSGHTVHFNSAVVRFRQYAMAASDLNAAANDRLGYLEVPAIDRHSGRAVTLVLDSTGYEVC